MNSNVTVINPTITEDKESKIRVAAYCRVSTNSEDQQNSLMTQMRYYENFLADSETERLVSVYADEGITGTRMDKREEFQRMLKDCRRGKIDRIIVKSISRFARNTKDCLSVLRELKELGISVMFEKRKYRYCQYNRRDNGNYNGRLGSGGIIIDFKKCTLGHKE